MTLSGIQDSLLIGTLLGDGAMRCKQNALLEINHCAAQKSYVDWKYTILCDLVRTPPRLRAGNGVRQAYRFTTLSLPALTPYYHAFYDAEKKRVPHLVLTPLALAVWFMDDGSKTHKAVYLNTQQFCHDDQMRLLCLLREQWGLNGSLNRDKTYYRIRLTVASTTALRSLIVPFVLPEMRYKLPA